MNSGYYIVGGKQFTNKIAACIEATKVGGSVEFNYYNEVWESIDTAATINCDLLTLYKLRAQQLRDTNDYLILNYSGGTDSWTILNTFLTNNIFLDEVVIKWPISAVLNGNRKVYTPDTLNLHPSNYLTEWEAFIQEDLKLVNKLSPKTKITIFDFSPQILTVPKVDMNNLPSNHFISLPSVIRMGSKTETETRMEDQGKKVGSIYGVDKPLLIKHDNECFLRFNDGGAQVSGKNIIYFFWAPDMPIVILEMAHRMFEWFQQNKQFQNVIDAKHFNYIEFTKIANKVCCPQYNASRFQTNKPTSVLNNEKDTWCKLIPEYAGPFNKWNAVLSSRFNLIDKKFLNTLNNKIQSIRVIDTKLFKIGTFDDS